MKIFKVFKQISSILLVLLFLVTGYLQAQVTVGSGDAPQKFSTLEVVSNSTGGLRLPHLTTQERDDLQSTTEFQAELGDKGKGLTIFNTQTNCIEYWNGKKWVSLCTGQANITFIDNTGNPTDPTQSDFPATGENRGPFTPVDNPNCTEENPAFDFQVMTGADYTTITIIDASTGKFTIAMDANPTARARTSVVRITNNCTKEYNEFLFTQEGDDGDCGTTTVPDILSYNGNEICQDGAIYLYLDGQPSTGTFIWTLNGQEKGRGAFLTVTEPGRYVVYGDKIGCPDSKEIIITAGSGGAPSPVNFIVVGNNGMACGAGGTVELVVTSVANGTIVWFKNGERTSLTGNQISAGAGEWFAVVEDGNCMSVPTETITVTENLNGGTVATPVMKINGLTSGWSFCKGGSVYLEVDSPVSGETYTWYIDNDEIGKGSGIYHLVPASETFVIRLRATGSGCAAEAMAIETVSTTQAPGAPFITVNSIDALCGGQATLTATNVSGATSYRWFKDGVEISGETSVSLVVNSTGSYTVSAIAGTCASIQSAAKTIIASDFATVNWLSNPATANTGDTKTYSVSLDFPQSASYTWELINDNGTNATITNGQGTSSITVNFPQTGDVTVRCTAANACGNAIGSPLTEVVTVTNACADAYISSVSTSVSSLKVGASATMSVTATGTGLTYQWYSGIPGGGTSIAGATSTSYTYTASATGSYSFYCVVTATSPCDNPATSDVVTITVTEDPSNIPDGTGTWGGKTCFDIADGNDNTNSCAPLNSRSGQKTVFSNRTPQDPATGSSAPYTGVQVYTFTPTGTVSNVRFDFVDGTGTVIDKIEPVGNYTGNNISSACKVTVYFKESLDVTLKGTTRLTGLTADLYVIYNSNAAGTGTDQKLKLTLRLQDCACCGAATVDGGWLTFMCHNLGADESLDPFTYKSNGNTVDADIKGYLYQWGRPSDGHEKRASGTTSTLATSNTPGHANFITASSSPYDWRSGGGNTTRWGDGMTNENQAKAANDPCPAGWKVPSQAQWQSIFKASGSGAPSTATANTWTWSTGYQVGDALYLPAAGYRNSSNASLSSIGSYGYYWSSTVNSTNSYYLSFLSGTVNPARNDGRAGGFSVRCVAE